MLNHQEDIRKIPEEESTTLTLPRTASSSPHDLIFYFNLAHLTSRKIKHPRTPMSNNIEVPIPVHFPSSPWYIPRSPSPSYHTCPTHPRTPPPWVVYHIPFLAMPHLPASEPSPILPYGSPPASPSHVSLTVNEIELYMLESQVQHDMANCLWGKPLAVKSWEHLQFEMRAAWDLEVLVWWRAWSLLWEGKHKHAQI